MRKRMKLQRRTKAFLIEIAIVLAIGLAQVLKRQFDIPASYVMVPALAALVPLFFDVWLKPYPRRARRSPR
jgi:hypothetical protein